MAEIIKEGDWVTVKPGKDIVASMAKEFREELRSVIKENPSELVLDLADVEMVDSVGIGVIIATHNSLSETGGKLRVVNVAKDIYGLFTTMRLDHHFTIESR